jgi:hypothetical protein
MAASGDPQLPDDRPASGARIPPAVWVVFTLIYLIIVPWYMPRDWIDPTLWAFPRWSLVTIGACAALAAFNAYVFLRLWPSGDDDEHSDAEREDDA